MTPKPKTRKAPAKRAAPKAAPKQASGKPKLRTISEVSRLITRWRFLGAEEDYHAAIAGTDEESNALICQHSDEQYAIELELSRSIPQDFNDVRELLQFAIGTFADGYRPDGAGVAMLRNILNSLPGLLGERMTAGRLEGAEKIRGYVAGILDDISRDMAGSRWPKWPI
jgi:hypothetical protein